MVAAPIFNFGELGLGNECQKIETGAARKLGPVSAKTAARIVTIQPTVKN